MSKKRFRLSLVMYLEAQPEQYRAMAKAVRAQQPALQAAVLSAMGSVEVKPISPLEVHTEFPPWQEMTHLKPKKYHLVGPDQTTPNRGICGHYVSSAYAVTDVTKVTCELCLRVLRNEIKL